MAQIGRQTAEIGTGPVSQFLNALLDPMIGHMGQQSDPNAPYGANAALLGIMSALARAAGSGPPVQRPAVPQGDPIQAIIGAVMNRDPAMAGRLNPANSLVAEGYPAGGASGGMHDLRMGARDLDMASDAGPMHERAMQEMMASRARLDPANALAAEGFPAGGKPPIEAMIGDQGGAPETPGMVSRDFKSQPEPGVDDLMKALGLDESAIADEAQAPVIGEVMNIDKGSRDHGGPGPGAADHADSEEGETGGDNEASEEAPMAKGPSSRYVRGKNKPATSGKGETPDIASKSMAAASDQTKSEADRASGRTYGVSNQRSVTVKKGESLWRIAERELGDGRRWKELARANKLSVKNPNMILVGQKITIPGVPKPGVRG